MMNVNIWLYYERLFIKSLAFRRNCNSKYHFGVHIPKSFGILFPATITIVPLVGGPRYIRFRQLASPVAVTERFNISTADGSLLHYQDVASVAFGVSIGALADEISQFSCPRRPASLFNRLAEPNLALQ